MEIGGTAMQGLAPSANRIPSDIATSHGLAWAARYAADLGPLPA